MHCGLPVCLDFGVGGFEPWPRTILLLHLNSLPAKPQSSANAMALPEFWWTSVKTQEKRGISDILLFVSPRQLEMGNDSLSTAYMGLYAEAELFAQGLR